MILDMKNGCSCFLFAASTNILLPSTWGDSFLCIPITLVLNCQWHLARSSRSHPKIILPRSNPISPSLLLIAGYMFEILTSKKSRKDVKKATVVGKWTFKSLVLHDRTNQNSETYAGVLVKEVLR